MVTDDLPRMVRERLDNPLELCRALGLLERFKRQTMGVLIRCPVHNESSPSCSVTIGQDRTVRWKCFACSASGDALTLVAAAHGLDVRSSFRDVLAIAAELAGVDMPNERHAQPRQPIQRAPAPAPAPQLPDSIFDSVCAVLADAGDLRRAHASHVGEYLAGRWLRDAAMADGWFAMGPWSEPALRSSFTPAILHRCGLTDESGRLKWPSHALAIPWRNARGEIQTLQRRHLGDCEAAKRYVFPTGRGPQSPYGIERMKPGPICIVEGAVDVLAHRLVDETGRRSVLGSPGVSGWRQSWDALANDRVVYLAFDNDDAGHREALKLSDRFYAAGAFAVRRTTPTRGKDWAEAMRASA